MKPVIRFTVPSDFEAFGEAPSPTVRAVTVVSQNEVLAIGGIAYLPGRNLAFMQSKPGTPAKALMKATRMAMSQICAIARGPVVAERDESIESSGRYLTHLGFEHMQDNLYIWKGAR